MLKRLTSPTSAISSHTPLTDWWVWLDLNQHVLTDRRFYNEVSLTITTECCLLLWFKPRFGLLKRPRNHLPNLHTCEHDAEHEPEAWSHLWNITHYLVPTFLYTPTKVDGVFSFLVSLRNPGKDEFFEKSLRPFFLGGHTCRKSRFAFFF